MEKNECDINDPKKCVVDDCLELSLEGYNRCERHLSPSQTMQFRSDRQNRYLIVSEQMKEGYTRQMGDAAYLNMRDEIALLHALLEKRVNAIHNEADLKAAHGPVTQIIQRLESMKSSLLKMQAQLGLVLNKDQLMLLAKDFANILNEELAEVPNKNEMLDKIIVRLCEAIEAAGTQPEE